jgi:hypothetical protein
MVFFTKLTLHERIRKVEADHTSDVIWGPYVMTLLARRRETEKRIAASKLSLYNDGFEIKTGDTYTPTNAGVSSVRLTLPSSDVVVHFAVPNFFLSSMPLPLEILEIIAVENYEGSFGCSYETMEDEEEEE